MAPVCVTPGRGACWGGCVAALLPRQGLESTVASGLGGVLGSGCHQPLRKPCYAEKEI